MFRMHGHFLATVFAYSIPAFPLTEQLARLIQEWLQRWLDFLRWHHQNHKSGKTILYCRELLAAVSSSQTQINNPKLFVTVYGSPVEQVRATSARTSPACRLLCPAGDMKTQLNHCALSSSMPRRRYVSLNCQCTGVYVWQTQNLFSI